MKKVKAKKFANLDIVVVKFPAFDKVFRLAKFIRSQQLTGMFPIKRCTKIYRVAFMVVDAFKCTFSNSWNLQISDFKRVQFDGRSFYKLCEANTLFFSFEVLSTSWGIRIKQ